MKQKIEREIWKTVPGWEYYKVSSLGRVISLDRIRKGKGFYKGKLLKCSPSKAGYPRVELYCPINGRRSIAVHRLVLLVFVGLLPKGKETRHLDGNSMNSKLSNLKYGTSKQNHEDAIRHGTTTKGFKHSLESKRKISLALKGHVGAFLGKKTYSTS